MKVSIVEGCIGCGLCAETCPNVFIMDDDGFAKVQTQPSPEEEAGANEAAKNCPVSVIVIDGEQQ